MNVYDSIVTGLQEAIAYEQGTLSAAKTVLSIQPLPEITPAEIRAIRHATGLTQMMFAAVMGVSVKTVEA